MADNFLWPNFVLQYWKLFNTSVNNRQLLPSHFIIDFSPWIDQLFNLYKVNFPEPKSLRSMDSHMELDKMCVVVLGLLTVAK